MGTCRETGSGAHLKKATYNIIHLSLSKRLMYTLTEGLWAIAQSSSSLPAFPVLTDSVDTKSLTSLSSSCPFLVIF